MTNQYSANPNPSTPKHQSRKRKKKITTRTTPERKKKKKVSLFQQLTGTPQA